MANTCGGVVVVCALPWHMGKVGNASGARKMTRSWVPSMVGDSWHIEGKAWHALMGYLW